MRLRFWVVTMTALLTATTAMANNGYIPRTGGNNGGVRWYGYFANNSYVPANAYHTNITFVWATFSQDHDRPTQLSDATNTIRNQVRVAAEYGEKAMVDVGGIVLLPGYNNPNPLCYQENYNAATDFQNLVQYLIDDGLLIPNDPESSTVSAFYVADEPDNQCLQDDEEEEPYSPSAALVNAIYAIRQNPNTTNFPLAATFTEDNLAYMPLGLSLFDWVGLDDYDSNATTDVYLNQFKNFENFANANANYIGGTPQHFYLFPEVIVGGEQTDGATPIGNSPFGNYFLGDDTVIGIMPYQWHNNQGTGMAGTTWAASYIALAQSIVHPPVPAETTGVINYVIAQ